MRNLVLAIMSVGVAAAFGGAVSAQDAAPDSVLGDWKGVLETPAGNLNLGLHVTAADDGLHSTLDSPDQGAMGIPMAETAWADGTLTVKTPAMGLEMDLAPTDDGALAGQFRQGGLDVAITFARADPAEEAALVRPQTPEAPFPYETVPASIDNPNAEGVTLAGELFVPEGEGPFPAAVLLSGSGGQNRDEELFGHKPFLVLADHLARNGIAVLRYDDRGVAESVGPTDGMTMVDIASDAAAALAWVKARPEVDAARAGFIGHSEGGTTGPMAAQNEDAAFLVLVAGVAVPFEDLLLEQGRLLREASDLDAEVLAKDAALQARLLEIARTASDGDDCLTAATAALVEAGAPEEGAAVQAKAPCSAWMRHALTLDLTAPIAAYDGPVLALFGTKDLQVPPHQNAEPMKAALDAGGNSASRVVVLDGLNHLMQPADKGVIGEYAKIETTFDPAALNAITAFVAEATAGL